MSFDLQSVRENIDALDDKIHDLLMQRAELIKEVSAIKRKYNKPIVHPAREAAMIRRLLNRHEGILPQSTVIGIWRELVGGVSMLQRGLHAYVSTEGNQHDSWDMAKDYCGSVIPMTRCESSKFALSYVKEKMDAMAVLPWPVDEDKSPWWYDLARQERDLQDMPDMTVIAALPFGGSVPYRQLESRALVISRMTYQPSGQDNSFFVLDIPADVSRASIVKSFSDKGVEALSVTLHAYSVDRKALLLETSGYLAPDSDIVAQLNKKYEDLGGFCCLIGGYPVPPILRSDDTAPVKLED